MTLLSMRQLVAGSAVWLLVAGVGAFAWHHAPLVGPGGQLAKARAEAEELRRDLDQARASARGWEASALESERLRAAETQTANAAAASLIEQCAARVAEARQSARVIERIVTEEPTYDPSGCPDRHLVDPGQLREALRPGGGTD